MATVTGLTAARMLEIEGQSIIDGSIIGGNLILEKFDGTTIDAGSVAGPQGPAGPMGPASISAIPGELKVWPGIVLPLLASYGRWVWADGAVYSEATYPIAASHIHPNWKTFGGASSPGAGNFRAPDLRGLTPAGLDQMPGGARANRMTRAIAITIAGKTGTETHVIVVGEIPSHDHGGGSHNHGGGSHNHGGGAHGHTINDPGHAHAVATVFDQTNGNGNIQRGLAGGASSQQTSNVGTGIAVNASAAIISTQANIPYDGTVAAQGGGGAHENIQPTVMVPWIVKLDD